MPPRVSGTGCASWCPPSLCAETSLGSGSVASGRAAVCREDSSGRVGNYRWVAWEELPHAGSCYSVLRRPARSAKCTSSERYFRPSLSMTRSEEHTSELQSPDHLVCRLLLEKKKKQTKLTKKHTN